jgi:hypothetical protein
MDRGPTQPTHLIAEHGQFARLGDVVNPPAAAELAPLLKPKIVDIPARAKPLDERRLLGNVRFGELNIGAAEQHFRSVLGSIKPMHLSLP